MIDLSFYKGKKVFITGNTGFKGSWLSKILVLAGADVSGFALAPTEERSLFDILEIEKETNCVIGDIRDLSCLERSLKISNPDIVFHMAAQPLVRLSYRDPVHTYATNVMGTVNVLEALRNCASVRSFVNVTTDKVYENREWPWGYRENENLCGFDPYSNSKSCSELVTYSYRMSFFNSPSATAISTARSGNVIGGGDFSPDRIIPDCVRASEQGSTINIRNPHSTRPYQHVLECLSGYLLLAQKQFDSPILSGSYNFGPDDDSCVTTGELVELFCDIWGSGVNWAVQGDGGPHEANYLKLDCSQAKTKLGWKPTWDIRKAVAKTVEFAKCRDTEEMRTCQEGQIREYFLL